MFRRKRELLRCDRETRARRQLSLLHTVAKINCKFNRKCARHEVGTLWVGVATSESCILILPDWRGKYPCEAKKLEEDSYDSHIGRQFR
jgi:hypothetical protein